MTRRLLVFACALSFASALLGSTLALAAEPARRMPADTPVVGMLVTHAAINDPGDALRAALRGFGYEDGRNIRLEIVTAAGELDRLPGLAENLVRLNVDVIICPNEVSVRSARQATVSTLSYSGSDAARASTNTDPTGIRRHRR